MREGFWSSRISETYPAKGTTPSTAAAASIRLSSLVNKGINGNRLLSGPFMVVMGMYGRVGMERFERDVLEEAGAKGVIIEMGTNDIGMARNPQRPDWVTAGKLKKAFEELAGKCLDRKIKIYGSTILPRGGLTGYLRRPSPPPFSRREADGSLGGRKAVFLESEQMIIYSGNPFAICGRSAV